MLETTWGVCWRKKWGGYGHVLQYNYITSSRIKKNYILLKRQRDVDFQESFSSGKHWDALGLYLFIFYT